MINKELTKEDVLCLCDWFRENQRTLPWRHTGNAYDIWLSEIMLQQTRVDTVIGYFLRFKEALPTINDLAQCDEDKLLKLWEGLGYYSRVRNLQKCAKVLVSEYQGVLPNDLNRLKKLPGIGPYTAGAIASQAYYVPTPAVDGNVLRVLARIFAIEDDIRSDKTKQFFEQVIQQFYDTHAELLQDYPELPSDLNQGLMELGAIVCLPNGQPKCDQCPWQNRCQSHIEQKTDVIPYRSKLNKKKIVPLTVLVIRNGDRFLLHKRPNHGLLAGLYEFINVPGHLNVEEAIDYVESLGYHTLRIHHLDSAKHIFTHLEWQMIGYEIRISDTIEHPLDPYFSVTKKELLELAVPSAFSSYMKYYDLR